LILQSAVKIVQLFLPTFVIITYMYLYMHVFIFQKKSRGKNSSQNICFE